MEAITGVSSVSAQYQATVATLQRTLDAQARMMQQLLANMGIGSKFDMSA